MDLLPIPPTPPAAPVMALPAETALASAPPANGFWAGVLKGLRVMGNLLLLPVRVLQRLALDLQTVLTHLFLAHWEILLALLAVGFVLLVMGVESFGENFFVGEVLQALIPGMAAYVPEAGALGMLLAMLFPALDEVRAGALFAFVVAGGGVLATSIFFHSLKGWQRERSSPRGVFQEALLLDPQVQETPPALLKGGRRGPPVPVGMLVGAGAQVLVVPFEAYAFAHVFESGTLGVLSSSLLLGVRLVFGYVAHFAVGHLLLHGRSGADHVVAFGAGLLAIVPNLIAEFQHRLETIGSD